MSAEKKLRIGIIGTGGISHCHMNGYLAQKDRVELVACCDLDEEKVKAYAEKFGFARYYTDCHEMMAKEELDCVSVCTWNAAHKECTIAALKGGANVICEKPMAMNAKEAQEMIDAANETGKLLQIGFVRRFGDDAKTVMNLKEAGLLGDIYYAKASYLRRDGCPGGWFADKAYSGGGPLIDLGVHVIDLVRYLSGCPKPTRAFGATYNHIGSNRAANAETAWARSASKTKFEKNVEDMATAMICFDNGLTVQLETSFNLNCEGDSTNVQVFGTKGGASLNGNVEFYTAQAGMYVNSKAQGETFFKFNESFCAEIKGFLDAAEGKAPCIAPKEDGLAVMKILDAVYESARTGKMVEID